MGEPDCLPTVSPPPRRVGETGVVGGPYWGLCIPVQALGLLPSRQRRSLHWYQEGLELEWQLRAQKSQSGRTHAVPGKEATSAERHPQLSISRVGRTTTFLRLQPSQDPEARISGGTQTREF